jgi:ABC-type transport system substrate-binding protein
MHRGHSRFPLGVSCILLLAGIPALVPAAQQPPADLEAAPLFAHPADQVELADGKTLDVEPVAADTLLDPQFTGEVTVREVGDDGQPGQTLLSVTKGTLKSYVPYERRVLNEVAKFEQAAKDGTEASRLAGVEKVLAATLRFHVATRERPLQGTNRWDAVQTDVQRRLLETRRRLLSALANAAAKPADWDEAVRFSERMLDTYPGDEGILAEVVKLRLRLAEREFAANNCAAARRELDWLEEHGPAVPSDPENILRGQLEKKAAGLLGEARATKDDAKALGLLKQARAIWPRLAGLEDELLRREGQYTILYVGVRRLPTALAPLLAVTDAELQALELLFERLVQPRPGEGGRLAYVPQLAAGPGTALDAGRSFSLVRKAYWSNGKRVTQADVLRSLQLMTNPDLPGGAARVADLADAIEPQPVEEDVFRVEFRYRRGLLDPLRPFAFPVMPADRQADPAGLKAFAEKPVGSGPYVYRGTLRESGRECAVFKVNPYYFGRPGHKVPKIREIRMFVSTDPVADFAAGKAPLHLLLDTPLATVGVLKKKGVEVRTMASRRVFFLAVNCADPVLADANLRRALAHGIDRERLLDEHFRGARRLSLGPVNLVPGASILRAATRLPGFTAHRTLNGPFPADTWANCADGRVPPAGQWYDPTRARKFLADSKQSAVELQLKYPDDDPRVKAACEAMARQLRELGASAGCPISVTLVPLPPDRLREDLHAGNYQLAYWRFDFPDDAFSLSGLLDPRGNYFGYTNDGALASKLVKAANHRDFTYVKKYTHDLHFHLYETMPLIPLWQLDVMLAVHPNLTLPATVDALRVFSNIEEWKLNK